MLQETIKHLKDVCRKENLDVSPNDILDNAVKIMISNNINKEHKEMYQNKEKSSQKSSNDEITPKQKAFLIKIKKYKDGMTKQDAFKIIQNLSKKEY